jgi:cytochrome c
LVFASVLSAAAAAAQTPGLGSPATVQELHAADITIMPDGEGLPAGSGDAATGADLYRSHCLACHGERGTGGINDTLAGGRGSLTSPTPLKTIGSYWPYATTLFDYVRRAMPYRTPGVLSDDQVYAVTAYLLFVNGIIGERVEMNAHTLPAVRMPNRDNFRWAFEP